MDDKKFELAGRLAAQLRVDSIRCSTEAGSGHPTSSLSAGVEIGQDGPSQMALEDIAALRAVHGSVVLYPADATSTVALVGQMADTDGVVYLRTTRGAYPVIYPAGEIFPVGGSKLHRAGCDDQVALIGAGGPCTNAWPPPTNWPAAVSRPG
jgi:transketolase